MSCSPNTPVKWSDIYAISSRIDELAVTLNTPGYTRLDAEPDMPFKFPDLVDFSGAIRFSVIPGTEVVIQQHLCYGVTDTTAYVLDPVLGAMGSNNDLFMVVEADGCWCKTIFQIDTNPGVPRVKVVASLGCCQSLYVPQPGDSLDRGQHIVPAGHVERYTRNNTASWLGTDPWYIHQACEKGAPSCGFHFSWDKEGGGGVGADQYTLLDVTREISSAKFTWPIRASHFDKMMEKLAYILACENSGGAKENAVKTGNPDPAYEYIWENCQVSICALVKDRVARSLMDYSTPGCVSTGCSPTFPPFEPTTYPWDTATCGGTNCDGAGPRLYCRTLQDLEAILDAAEDKIHPYNPPTHVCGPCACEVILEYEGRSGYAESCLLTHQYDETRAVVAFYEYIGYRDLLGTGTCETTVTHLHAQGLNFSECGSFGSVGTGTVVATGSCASTIHDSNPGCPPSPDPPGELWVGDTYSTGFDLGVPPSLIDEAIEAHNSCPAVPRGGYALYSNGYFTSEVASFRWRIRVKGEWSCSSTPPPVTVDLKRQVHNSGTESETIVPTTATWDDSEGTLVSPWVSEPIPSAVTRGQYHLVRMVYDGPAVRCPKSCYQL